ncbi:hypothetical protein ILUMI_03116 [Ignelater luminosus]|uniref:Uncharacterized protein n=1 Tax=Ignelater luminosus TaxID=2038154 RepID=A0A8K0GIM6_IGNLU|nr:hypothetical protein ILUMI_03116 [Ignelater luminosus]
MNHIQIWKEVYFAEKVESFLSRFSLTARTGCNPSMCVYGPFKNYLKVAFDDWYANRSNSGKKVSNNERAKLTGRAFSKAFTIGNNYSRFKKCGIVPSNKSVFTTADFQQHLLLTHCLQPVKEPKVREKVVEPVSKIAPPAVDKQATPDEIPKSVSRKAIKGRKRISRSATLNSSKEVDKVGRIEKLPKGVSRETKNNKNSIMLGSISNEDSYSFESEENSKLDYLKAKKTKEKPESVGPERKKLVYQQDSFEDELPYVGKIGCRSDSSD